ncbi:LOW QUALITY PROTEIN: cubilin-like [Oppia nitens]|uniref:LOW QUALITY PROTEIN: cubilin-like n=1 Tax=Oppia nitens TaxID=1686743 RepID=UPI0023DB63FE|nr:LOW QUALITY PROTEIN: cubilin-like [Oppia nitens]
MVITIICCISNSFIDPFDGQSKIVVKDGHIFFETANNKDINFKTGVGGKVMIDGQDLSRIAELAKDTNLEGLSNSKVSQIQDNVETLKTQMANVITTIAVLRAQHTSFNDSTNKLNRMLGTGSNAMSPITVRRTLRKIQRIDTSLNRLTQLLETNECQSNPCRNGGSCVDTYNGFICQCIDAWEGPTCDTDVNECQRFYGTELGCQNGATCINNAGGYRCMCTANWYGTHCTSPHDDCSSATNEALCGHGTCVNQQRSVAGSPNYRCICDQGWTSTGQNPACIVDINECTEGTPHCSTNPTVQCINLPGTFFCGPCPPGFTGNGYYCHDINECETINGGCSVAPRVQCINTIGSRICSACPPGYNGDGTTCQFVGTCRVNNGGCHPMAQCYENMAISTAFRECRCPGGYVGNGVGLNGCVTQTGTTCDNNPCSHGSCLPNGNSFTCVCISGYTGSLCEQEINECLSNPCQNGGTCTDQTSGFLCVCTSQWRGTTCSDPRQTCGGSLNSEVGTFSFPIDRMTTYPNQVSCAWGLTTTSGKVLNITFHSFNIEYTNDCSYDFLQINDGPNAGSHNLGRFCGTRLPFGGNIVATHHQLYIWFKSDHSVGNQGFQFDWNTTDPVCGGELEPKDYGSVNSPGYPGKYPHNRDCYWLIRVPLGKRIQFHFATLQIEAHLTCGFDYIELFDGQRESDPLLGKFCNTSTPAPLTSAGAYVLMHFHSDDSFNDNGFHITYASVAGIPGCGGTLTAEKGTLSSPNFPNRYENNIDCDWIIRVHPMERIEIKFSLFDLESHNQCSFDFLEIREGDNSESPLINRLCGQQMPRPIVSNSNKLWIKFKADVSQTGQGFRAEYTTVCGGLYTNMDGVITSPFFPDSYPSDRKCLYHIVLPVGFLIQLNFQHFNIEESLDCAYDYLEIQESGENSTSLGKYCGTVIPDPITSKFNELLLKFGTDGSNNNKGFYANYTSIEIGCGGVYTTNHGVISSPSSITQGGTQCSWLVRTDPGFAIKLTFTMFALKAQTNCSDDYVEIRDSTYSVIGKYCGSRLPPILTSSGNQLFITFKVSNILRAQEGFAAAYSFLDLSHSCGGNFFTDSGIIRSPGYPNRRYPPNRECIWVLQVDNGRQIVLNVTDFQLEGVSGCRYDFLEIRNGREERSPLIGSFCGTNIPPTITSHGHVLFLRFKSDNSRNAKGFEITYNSGTTGCGGTLTSQSGSIESPGYPQPYSHNAECVWLIRVSQGSTITLTFADIDIEAHTTCRYDYLEVFDGNTDRSPSLGKYCNSRMNSHLVQSKSNVMYIKFKTDTSETGRGFRLNYQINCSTILSGYRGVIESPNFPEPYNNNANCTWRINVPRGNNITIAFSRMVIESDMNCQYDYLKISNYYPEINNSTQIAKYCGISNQLPIPFNTTTNNALVNFVTDAFDAHIGFRFEWVSVGCGGDFVNKNNGELMSPNYPNGYPHDTECLWHIQASYGYSIHLTVYTLDIEGVQGCSFDYIHVHGGPDETSPQLLNLCHRIESPQTVSSMGRSMTVKFRTDSSVSGRGFMASFQVMAASCSAIYNTETGTITSPKFPLNYDSNDDCEYTIDIKGLHDIELKFEEFGIPLSVNCTDSYLAIYDGSSSGDPLIIKHCGTSLPAVNPIRSTSNKVYMRMKANGFSVGKGFKISYKTLCGGRKVLGSNEVGELTSPNFPHHSVYKPDCHWILVASQPEEHITLTFTRIDISGTDCEQNYVEVRDGDNGGTDGGSNPTASSPLIGKYCGDKVPPPITSLGNSLYIVNTFGLFRATYTTSTSYCGGTFTSHEGVFQSPAYPNSYPLETECIWIISASPGNRVTFNFITFNIEESDYCNTDYLELRENDSSGPLLGRYCGQQIPSLNFTSTHILWVKFRSDQSGTAPGFQASYALEHGIDLVGESGAIANPGWPYDMRPKDTSFSWSITVSQNKYIGITFTEISIPSYGTCTSYVSIIDGIGESGPEIGRYCGYTIPDTISSTTNTLTVNFIMTNSMPAKFYLTWNAINETAALALKQPVTIDTNNSSFDMALNRTGIYRLLSPGYPNGYTTNLNINWTFHTLPTYHFMVNITDMILPGNNRSCNYYGDRVYLLQPRNTLGTLWKINKTLCGRYRESLDTPLYSKLRINFRTNDWYNLTGFDLTVQSVCGANLYGSRGYITTDDIVNAVNCIWTIKVREGRTIKLTFESINISDNNNCQYSYIMIRNGNKKSSPPLGGGRYCGRTPPNIPESASNRVMVEFYGRRDMHTDFRLLYEEVSVGCGGQIELTNTNTMIEIMSPNYPLLPPHNMECDWVVMSPHNTNIRLDFEYDSSPTWRCNKTLEFVEIRDGGTAVSALIDKYCVPPQYSNSIKSSGSYMFVRFVTANTEQLVNFKAKIQINDCGGTYMICTYLLKTTYNNNLMDLNITFMDIVGNSDCSSGDYVEFHDNSPTGDLIGRYCGRNEDNSTIQLKSESSSVYIIFKSDTQLTGRGLRLSVRTRWTQCGDTIENIATNGVITSFNYPNAVSERRYCSWYLTSVSGRSLRLEFLDYNLKADPRNTSLCLDHLNIFKGTYGSTKQKMQCNAILPDPIQFQSHMAVINFGHSGLAPREGFRIQYSADDEEVCGGLISGTSGIIESYRFGESNYTDPIDCIWEIQPPNQSTNFTIAFVFDVFEIPESELCKDGSIRLEYYNRRYRYFWSRGYRFCGNKTTNGHKFDFFAPNQGEYNYGVPKLLLSTNYSNNYRGISGKYYIQECGGYFDNPDGEFTSPNFPQNYPIVSYCVWEFAVDWGQQLRLSFLNFSLGSDCEKDYIQVQQGYMSDSPKSDKYCGNTLPPEIHSTQRKMKVMFKATASNPTQSPRNFKMYVRKVEHGCGGLMLNPIDTIHTLDYPIARYANSIECVWIIQMHTGYHLNFTFIDRFDIEKSQNCVNDYLLFEELANADDDNSWTAISRFCGLDKPQSFKSRTNKVRVTFHSNEATNGDGFKLTYQMVCGEVFTESTGVFTSPNYPNVYNNMIRCEYLIQRSPKDYIRLEFDDDFDVEYGGSQCRWDAIDIYLGNNTSSPHQGTYCGRDKPPITVSNNAIFLAFRSDYSYVRKGFKASFSVTSCGGNYTDDSGVITNPINIYGRRMSCIWFITVSEDRVIELQFNSINTDQWGSCYWNGVEIRDGDNSSAPLIGRFCKPDRDIDPIIKSTTNKLWIIYRTEGHYERAAFSLSYRTTLSPAQGCGGKFYNVSQGYIQSPDVDNNGKYDLDLNCWYTILMPSDKVVKLTFEKLDIEESPSNGSKCIYDYLEIRDGITHRSALIDRYCGSTIPSPIIGSSNKLILQFYSDSREVRTGFKAKFESIDKICGGFVNVTNMTQTLTSINYPNSYPTSLRCKYHFIFDRVSNYWSKAIRIKFIDLDVNCNNEDYIEFSADTYSHNHIQPYRMCGLKAPPSIISRQGLWLTFVSSPNPVANHKGFKIQYTFSACNMTYSDESGIIVNTRYPDTKFTKYCWMNITAKVGHTIALYFNDFRFYNSDNRIGCPRGNMTIREGIDTTSPLLKVLCGTTIPDPIFSTGNQLSLEVKSNEWYYSKWFISYSTTNAGRGCGGNLTSFNGTFTSPLYPSPYNVSGECRWFVHSFGLHSLTLRFTFFQLSSTIGCRTNYVEVYEGREDLPSNRVLRICGDDNPAPYQSQGNLLLIKLVTSTNNTGPGFRAQYNFNSIELNATKVVMTSDLRTHMGSDGSVYFPSDGIMFRRND